MKKDNNNRRKVAIGAVLAAGVTTGAITACATGNKSKPAQSEKPEIELTAADKVVIDGREVDSTELMLQDKRHLVRPMYGVRQRPIKLVYGPRPGRDMEFVPEPEDNVLNDVFSDVARIAELDSTYFSKWIPLSEQTGFTPEKRQELKEAIEKRFNLEIDDEVFDGFKELWDIVKYVRRFRPDY